MSGRRSARPVLFVDLVAAPARDDSALNGLVGRAAARYGLTEREVEVAELYARGRSRSFIADALCIAEHTAADHISHIYKKLRVHNKQEFIDLLHRQ